MSSWNWNRIFAVALAISALVFIYTICMVASLKSRMEEIEINEAAIHAEVEHNTSWGTMIPQMGKAFFDGLTFGMFAEKGMFTEYEKMKEWQASVVERSSRNKAEFEQCYDKYITFISGRNWFGIFTIISVIGYIATRQKKIVEHKS